MYNHVPVICFVAEKSGTGKTTFLEKLIGEIVQRGYEVGAIKSDAHGFEMDKPGKDSYRFAQAGAKATAIIGPNKYALIQKTDTKKDLEDILPLIEGVDIIVVEGYKASTHPRIEVVRNIVGTNIISPPEYLIAIITDVVGLSTAVPVFGIDDVQGIADLIIQRFLQTS